MDMSQQTTSTSLSDEQEPSTESSTQLVPIGTNLELVDDDDNGQENTTITHHPEPQSGTDILGDHLQDMMILSHIKTGRLLRRGDDVTVDS